MAYIETMATADLSPEAESIRRSFGSMLRRMRKDRKLSQAALGQLAGIGPSMISQIESGVCGTTLDRIALLMAAMEAVPVITTEQALAVDADLAAVIEAWPVLDPHVRAGMAATARTLKAAKVAS